MDLTCQSVGYNAYVFYRASEALLFAIPVSGLILISVSSASCYKINLRKDSRWGADLGLPLYVLAYLHSSKNTGPQSYDTRRRSRTSGHSKIRYQFKWTGQPQVCDPKFSQLLIQQDRNTVRISDLLYTHAWVEFEH